ncbi:hypothetical protein B0H66DRAFT_539344 [Apodospora peruviana]|uniref:2EXR domain-containing protein n=1 Tax=Apodospora peruviana TaxID=516989 RepID=A0AAE0IPQ6_9PEZI|nr:hypothetical protein B0H66DRAFT_539344 [Apodospora peruviana]
MATHNNQFTIFTRFPREIRNMIWDLALRDYNLPGVHFFTFTPPDAYRYADIDSEFELEKLQDKYKAAISVLPSARIKTRTTSRCTGAFSIPGKFNHLSSSTSGGSEESLQSQQQPEQQQQQLSWFDENNPSVYRTDAGLWGTCRESRAAVIRALARLPPELDKNLVRDDMDRDCRSSKAAYLISKSANCHFSIRSHDLVVIRFPTETTYYDFTGSPVNVFPSPMVAIEIDPSWRMPARPGLWYGETDPGSVAGRLANLRVECTRIWLIDYRLRRKPGRFTGFREDRFVFHGLEGSRYVQVRYLDSEWEWRHDDGNYNKPPRVRSDDPPVGSPFRLAEEIERDYCSYVYDIHEGDGSEFDDGLAEAIDEGKTWDLSTEDWMMDISESYGIGGVGVLACETLD